MEEICRNTAVGQEVAAGDEAVLRPHDQRGKGRDLVRRAGAASGHLPQHRPIETGAFAMKLVMRQRVTMMPGLITLIRAPRLAQSTASPLGKDDGAAQARRARRPNRKKKYRWKKALYRERNRVERFFNKLKNFRRIATRYDKLGANFFAFIQLASIRIFLRSIKSTP